MNKRLRDGTVIVTNAHTHSPPTQTLFSLLLHLNIYLYIYTYIGANKNLLRFTDLLLPHMYTLNKMKCIKLANKLSEMCSIPYEKFCHKRFSFTTPSLVICTLKCSSVVALSSLILCQIYALL